MIDTCRKHCRYR